MLYRMLLQTLFLIQAGVLQAICQQPVLSSLQLSDLYFLTKIILKVILCNNGLNTKIKIPQNSASVTFITSYLISKDSLSEMEE